MQEPRSISYSFAIADLFHYGHLNILKTAKENSDYHICGVISDEVSHLWQGINICNYDEREAVIKSLVYVDEVVKQDSMDPTENLKRIRIKYPNAKIILVHGNNWGEIPGKAFVESIGGDVILPEYYDKLSRDEIISKLQRKNTLDHENYNQHFRIGNVIQFNTQGASPLISTKANTLKNFKNLLTKSRIEEIFILTSSEFSKFKEQVISSIQRHFGSKKLIVRSSCSSEDSYSESNAGKFISVLNVNSESNTEISNAIIQVLNSYPSIQDHDDQVLIQAQTVDVKKSGVIFTRNLKNNLPFYVVEYDDQSGKTDTVTGGEHSQSIWLERGLEVNLYPVEWRNVLAAVIEIEKYLPEMILDIEFGETRSGDVVIYQIRPLAANIRCADVEDEEIFQCIESNQKQFIEISKERKSSLLFSDMAFWNPAEIIGVIPRPLDYSLYEALVTRKAWNDGIVEFGYSKVDGDLMVSFGLKPYIDLQKTFKALTPESLPAGIKDKLINYYDSKLRRNLSAHDKVEFEIILNCYDFSLEKRASELLSAGFSNEEIKILLESLKKQTEKIINTYSSFCEKGLHSLFELEKIRLDIVSKVGSNCFQQLASIIELIEATEKLGVIPFSGMARCAFISKSLLNSVVDIGAVTSIEIDNFLEGLETVATEFNEHFSQFLNGEITKTYFDEVYGHLRAGTYNIRNITYREADFKTGNSVQFHKKDNIRSNHNLNYDLISKILHNSQLNSVDTEKFLHFISSSIVQRENFKFIFTRSLSFALDLIVQVGERLGFSRDDLSYLDMLAIKSSTFCKSEEELKSFWKIIIQQRRLDYSKLCKIPLPPVVSSEDDFRFIPFLADRPNFITSNKVSASIVLINEDYHADIAGKIVLLEKADPGFDWIFTKDIKGLITKYGGVASHMAIRCAEFDVPAAIGCGENIFNLIVEWDRALLDCAERKITKIL